MKSVDLFESGTLGYSSYRIPSIITLPDGRVLAFCEGRVESSDDTGEIHIILRIGDGSNFRRQKIIAKNGANTVGNPTPVYDRDTGEVWLLLTGNGHDARESDILENLAERRVFAMRSQDGGETWSRRRDITRMVKRPGWTWYATGPCHAIQTSSGRLLIPCNHGVYNAEKRQNEGYQSHVIYSDDHGATWQIGGFADMDTNECSLAELPNGDIYFNMRSYKGRGLRAWAISRDGGESFGETQLDERLPDPVCQGSCFSLEGDLYFSNAATADKREKLTLRRRGAGERCWRDSIVVCEGSSAYSDITALPDGRIGVIYERDDYKFISLATIDSGEI